VLPADVRLVGHHMVGIRQFLLSFLICPNQGCICHTARYQDLTRGQSLTIEADQVDGQVYKVPVEGESEEGYRNRELYNRNNAFFTSAGINDLLGEIESGSEKDKLLDRIEDIKDKYSKLSEIYQKSKGGAGIPLA
jgi:hypothetical protein